MMISRVVVQHTWVREYLKPRNRRLRAIMALFRTKSERARQMLNLLRGLKHRVKVRMATSLKPAEHFAPEKSGPIQKSDWNYRDPEEKLYQLGTRGVHPTDLNIIGQNRRDRADRIAQLLEMNRNDVVLDLGSGMGFMAEHLASRVYWMHCADISEVYLVDCRERVASLSNVETHIIAYADLSPLNGKGVSKAYSSLLFIHFNFYDLVFYLRELHRIMNEGGLLFFDFNDGDRYKLNDVADSFTDHIADFRARRDEWIFGCMHMLSGTTLRNILPQIGFEIVGIYPTSTAFSEIVVRKVGHQEKQ